MSASSTTSPGARLHAPVPAAQRTPDGLAEVICLGCRRADRAQARATAATYRRRRAVALLLAVALVAAVVLGARALGASAEPSAPAAGHVVLAPGQTLWEIAVLHAPAGEDPRAYLERVRRVNGFGSGGLPPWTVVLLPAR